MQSEPNVVRTSGRFKELLSERLNNASLHLGSLVRITPVRSSVEDFSFLAAGRWGYVVFGMTVSRL